MNGLLKSTQFFKLSDPNYHREIGIMPRWRIGDSVAGKNEIYPYYDADQCEEILDAVCGVDGWGCEYREVSGILFCSISIITDSGIIEKADAGGARGSRKKNIEQVDKDTFEAKTAATGAFVRAASKCGIGRHLSMLPKIRLQVASGVAIGAKGEQLRTPDELSAYCNGINPGVTNLVSAYMLNRQLFDSNDDSMRLLKELKQIIEAQ